MVTVAKRRGVFIEWRLVKMLTLALMVLMLGVASFLLLRPTASERGTQSLVKAFSKRRLIEPRLSGGFKAGVFIKDNKGRAGVSEYDLNRAEELIEDAVNDNNPKTQLAYGNLLMSTLNNADALKQFRKAVAGAPESAEPHNDIGVCLMESDKLEDALEEFNTALKLKDAMPEALFNRGLCYQRLLLRDAANEDYTRLIKVERDRGWSEEAKGRQEAVSAPIEPMKQQKEISEAFDAALGSGDIEGAKSIAKQYLEIVLKNAYVAYPMQYLKARNAGKLEEANRTLSNLQWVGQYFFEAGEDSSIADLASYLRDLPPEKLQSEASLIYRHLQAESGKTVTGKTLRGAELQATYQELAKQFEQEGNHLFHFFAAQNDATHDHYIAGKYASAVAKLTDCLKIIDKYSWSYRKAQVYSNLGNAGGMMAQDALGLKYCDQALIHCKNAPSLQSKILQYKANAYTHLGDVETGLAQLRKSTGLLMESAPQFGELAVNCLLAADLYRLINNHSLAMLYAKQALAFAEEKNRLAKEKNSKDAGRILDAASFVGVEHARLNEIDQAQQQMERAFDEIEKVDNQSRFIALMRAAEMASLQNNTALSLENYNKAELIAGGIEENTLYLMSTLRGRAEVYAQAGDYEHAGEDLKRAVSLIEYYFKTISERKNRSDFLDVSHNVFDQVIALNIQAFSKGEEAFNYSERSRARALLNDIAPKAKPEANQPSPEPDGSHSQDLSNPMTLAEVQAALPEDLRLVTYSVTDKGTFIFLVTHSGFEWAESPVTTDELDRLAQDYVFGIKNMASIVEISEAARKLYGHLIRPVANKINDGKRLCIVPDKALNLVPFAALIDDSDQYLIESFRLTYAPSATVLALCLEESRRKGSATEEKILAVGNPMFNHKKFKLAEIPEAEQEAIESAALYSPANREVLIGAGATKQKVRAALPNCDIAHLALHCLVNEKTPLLAALVLADPNRNQTPDDQEAAPITPGAQDDSLLYLNDIYSLTLPRTKLVILSACNSALGQYYRGEGIVSLVRPFLARRVPTVIASLWPVSSQATAALMIDFHRERKGNNTGAGDALRAAQRRMVRSSSYQHPIYWAAFMVVGSNA